MPHHIKNTLSKFCNKFCKENVNKDIIPDDLKSFLVYKFTCASCSSNYILDTCRHFKTKNEEHIKNDNKTHIFKHLHTPLQYDALTCVILFPLK